MMDFRKINKNKLVNGKRYSVIEDYLEYFNLKYKLSPKEVLDSDDLVIDISKNWISQGQIGCAFAKYMSHSTDDFGWKFEVCRFDTFSKEEVSALYSVIDSHINNPESETLSILFPYITEESQFYEMLDRLIKYSPFFLDSAVNYGDNLKLLAIRLDISGKGNNSWIMALAPFEEFPITRQSPITQLVIRLKVKDPSRMYHQAKNVADAHNADMPIDIIAKHKQDALWDASFKNTERVLGHKPDDLSAAKYTCPIPIEVYDVLFNSNGESNNI